MDKMQYPRGLIRYDTQTGMQRHLPRSEVLRRVLRPRVLVYTAVLVLISGALMTSLWMRAPFKVDVVRDRGALARIVEDGYIANVYRLQIMNTTEQVQRYRIGVQGLPRVATDLAGDVVVESAQARWVPVAVTLPPDDAARAGAGSHAIEFVVETIADTAHTAAYRVQEHSTFIVPR
jgi:polyferredoxin